MKIPWLLVAGAWALPLGASTINATGDTNIVLHTGDELLFRINIRNYQTEAPLYNAPVFPLSFSFTLVTEPTVSPAAFQAGLESLSGRYTEAFPGQLTLQPGLFDSSTYSGPTSTLGGGLSLSGTESRSLFESGAGLLYIEDLGGDVTIGLPPYTLPEDLYASAGGGPISVGAITRSARLVKGPADPVPEPSSGLLLLGGGVGLCVAATFLRRLQLRHDASTK